MHQKPESALEEGGEPSYHFCAVSLRKLQLWTRSFLQKWSAIAVYMHSEPPARALPRNVLQQGHIRAAF